MRKPITREVDNEVFELLREALRALAVQMADGNKIAPLVRVHESAKDGAIYFSLYKEDENQDDDEPHGMMRHDYCMELYRIEA